MLPFARAKGPKPSPKLGSFAERKTTMGRRAAEASGTGFQTRRTQW